jgi:hypothetical protein
MIPRKNTFNQEHYKKVDREADGNYMEYFIKRIVFQKGRT